MIARMPHETYDQLKARADRNYRSVSAEVRRLIEEANEQEAAAA